MSGRLILKPDSELDSPGDRHGDITSPITKPPSSQLARTERIRTSKYFLGVAQKAHIKSTSQVILSDTENNESGASMSRAYRTADVHDDADESRVPMSRADRTVDVHDDAIIAFLLFCLEIYKAEQQRKRTLH